jgi:uncharacterized membrane protein YfcA
MDPALTSALIELLLIVIIGIFAGIIGSLVGLGGGVVLTPLLTLFLKVPIAYATGVSLISTIATSSGSASAYIKDKITNVRIGMGLEIATTLGAIIGSLIASYIYSHSLFYIIYISFGIILISSIPSTLSRGRYELPLPKRPDKTTKIFRLNGKYFDPVLRQEVQYWGIRWWLAEIIMFFAGIISGLLGIGSGALKVLAMDWGMNLPMRVSTTTSNFMIGVTAATGSSIYWYLGYIQPFLAAGTAIGVLIGAFIGTKILIKITNRTIRWIFSSIIIFLGIEMIIKGIVAIGILLPLFYEYLIPSIITAIFIIGVYIRVRIKNET